MYKHILEHNVIDKQIILHAGNADNAVEISAGYLSAWAKDEILEENKITKTIYRNTLVYPKTDREPELFTQTIARLHFYEGKDVSNLNLWLIQYHIV